MVNEVALAEIGAPVAPECRHHWLIESPHGATSWGACKLCGERREFTNSAADALWEGEGLPTSKGGAVTSYGARGSPQAEDDEGF